MEDYKALMRDFDTTNITVKIEATGTGLQIGAALRKLADRFEQKLVWEGSDHLRDQENRKIGWMSLTDNEAVDI